MGSINTTAGKTGAFADSKVGGSKFLDVGIHKNVKIIEATDVLLGAKNSPALKLVLEASDGRQMRTTIFYTGNKWIKGVMTDEVITSYKLNSLMGSLVKDQALRGEVFGPCFDNTLLFERLIGFTVNIEVAYPKKGHVILRNGETEDIAIHDLKADVVIKGGFESFTDAQDYMKEEGLARAYTDIAQYFRTQGNNGEDINLKSIQAFIKTAAKASNAKGTVSPLGQRTAGNSI